MAGGAGVKRTEAGGSDGGDFHGGGGAGDGGDDVGGADGGSGSDGSVRRNSQNGLVGRHGAALRRQNPRGLGTIW